uniref:Uncharacterized protein n=1 Tax=Fagus sylvatica TaxID=28930 RepID=A0A2N9FFC5_FAGSY
MILLVYKESYLNLDETNQSLPSLAVSLLQEFEDVFPEEMPNELPPIRGIVITPFLPPGFSRVSARKTRQPEPSRSDPTRARRIKYSQEEGPRHISQAYLGGNVCAKILSDPLQLGPRAKTLRQEVHFSYHTHATFGSSRAPPVTQAFRRYQDRRNPTSGATSTTRVKTGRRNKALLKFPEFSHRRCHACAQSLPDSQQVDLRARAHWKEDTSMHDVELSDRQEFIGVSRNPDRKTALKRTKNTPVDSARGAISHESKLGFPQIRNLAKIGSASFPTSLSCSQQVDPRARVRWKDNDSGYDVELSVRRRSIPRLTGIFAGRSAQKTAPTPRLPGAITPSSELRFVQTLYRWKEDVESFPTICRMTHFEFQKTSKTAPENRIKKGTRTEIEEDSRSCWRGRIRLPRGSTTTRAGPPSSRAAHDGAPEACTVFYKKTDPPPSFAHVFARALGLLER